MTCEHCGACIDENALSCPFCKASTPLAAHMRVRQEEEARARAEWQAHGEQQRRAALEKQMNATATYALVWSLVGTFVCCLPIPVVGIVQGARARSFAARLRVPTPGKAIAGIVLGILGSLSSIGLITYGFIASAHDQERADARIAQLEKELGTRASSPQLDHGVACALAEIHARRGGFDGEPGSSLENFECVGRLSGGADRAKLENFRFTKATSKFDVNVCFKRGALWFVQDIQHEPCP